MIYADNAATTKLSPVALEAMMPYLTGEYGNPSSLYRFAGAARKALEESRADIAACLNADPGEIVFTSGGTESDNWPCGAWPRLWASGAGTSWSPPSSTTPSSTPPTG